MTAEPPMRQSEFIILMALMISIVALSIDAMLPALPDIGTDLGAANPNDAQLVISILFVGLAAGQLFYGPLSDSYGRRPLIFAGFALFAGSTLMCMFASSFEVMLAGRLIQGFGAAGPRIVCTALIRDLYEGRAMARIMSFIMAVFILVPAIAPALGQIIILVSGWRMIFAAFLMLAAIASIWFALRQDETLPQERRIAFSAGNLWRSALSICRNRQAAGYTLISGLIFGAFVGYLTTAQQTLEVQYELGQQFPVYFAVLALAVGGASFINGRLVMRFGMRYLSLHALISLVVLSIAMTVIAVLTNGHPALWIFITYCLALFFCLGVLFGNFNALAMEPLGDTAGLGAAFVGFFSTMIAVILGGPIGQAYDGTIIPLVLGFAVLGAMSLAIMLWLERKRV